MIYANLPDGSYHGHTVEVTVLSRRGVWFKCKFPDGTVKEIHRDYMTTNLKDLGILDKIMTKCDICNFESDNPLAFRLIGKSTYCNLCYRVYTQRANEQKRMHKVDIKCRTGKV